MKDAEDRDHATDALPYLQGHVSILAGDGPAKSRPVRDAGEDLERFELRCAKWERNRWFRLAAKEKVAEGPTAVSCKGAIDFGPQGAWVTVEIFVSWKQAGQHLTRLWREDEP